MLCRIKRVMINVIHVILCCGKFRNVFDSKIMHFCELYLLPVQVVTGPKFPFLCTVFTGLLTGCRKNIEIVW